jgi:hypothetical protein
MESLPSMVNFRKRSVSPESMQQAKENLRVLKTEREVAEQIIRYTQNRLTMSVERGEISTITSEKLLSRLYHDLNNIVRDVYQYNKILLLYSLESSQVYLIQEFNNKVAELNEEVKNIRAALKVHSHDATTYPHSPYKQVITPTLTQPLSVFRIRTWYHRSLLLSFLIITSLVLLSPYTFGLLSAQYMTSSTGIVASVDLAVYQNSSGTQNLTTLNWGTICPGQGITQVIFVKNNGNVNVTLHLEAINWHPSAASRYITVNWDFTQGDIIMANVITPIQISLSVSAVIQNIQTFNFDILLISNSIP